MTPCFISFTCTFQIVYPKIQLNVASDLQVVKFEYDSEPSLGLVILPQSYNKNICFFSRYFLRFRTVLII